MKLEGLPRVMLSVQSRNEGIPTQLSARCWRIKNIRTSSSARRASCRAHCFTSNATRPSILDCRGGHPGHSSHVGRSHGDSRAVRPCSAAARQVTSRSLVSLVKIEALVYGFWLRVGVRYDDETHIYSDKDRLDGENEHCFDIRGT